MVGLEFIQKKLHISVSNHPDRSVDEQSRSDRHHERAVLLGDVLPSLPGSLLRRPAVVRGSTLVLLVEPSRNCFGGIHGRYPLWSRSKSSITSYPSSPRYVFTGQRWQMNDP